jgi:hypothetical protein
LGDEIYPVKSCQIATRFPGENLDSMSEEKWHIDNFTEKDFERSHLPKEFDILVGILLCDNDDPSHGNFTCFPGGHHQLRAYGRKKCGKHLDNSYIYNYFKTNGLSEARNDIKLSNPHQICAKFGSVIIADRMLPHLVSAPNISESFTRTIIWYRVQKKSENFTKFIGNNTPDWTTDLELEGKGYMSYLDNEIMSFDEIISLRLKPRIKQHIPNAFGSITELKLLKRKDMKIISVHTGGFLSKQSHKRLSMELEEIFKYSGNDINVVINKINEIDFQNLIERWFPVIKQSNSTPESSLITKYKLLFHHLHSFSKTKMIQEWANNDFNIKIDIVNGTPGIISMEGTLNNITQLVDRIFAFYWNKVPEMQKCD